MDLGRTIQRWNRLVMLKQPSLGMLKKEVGVENPSPIFPNSRVLQYLGDNVCLKMPLVSQGIDDERVQSVMLVTTDRFFAPTATVKTETMSSFSILGIRLPCDAEHFVEELRRRDTTPLSLGTELDRWVVSYGRALSFLFPSSSPIATVPKESSLAVVEFFYTLPFEGQQQPIIAAAE